MADEVSRLLGRRDVIPKRVVERMFQTDEGKMAHVLGELIYCEYTAKIDGTTHIDKDVVWFRVRDELAKEFGGVKKMLVAIRGFLEERAFIKALE